MWLSGFCTLARGAPLEFIKGWQPTANRICRSLRSAQCWLRKWPNVRRHSMKCTRGVSTLGRGQQRRRTRVRNWRRRNVCETVLFSAFLQLVAACSVYSSPSELNCSTPSFRPLPKRDSPSLGTRAVMGTSRRLRYTSGLRRMARGQTVLSHNTRMRRSTIFSDACDVVNNGSSESSSNYVERNIICKAS